MRTFKKSFEQMCKLLYRMCVAILMLQNARLTFRITCNAEKSLITYSNFKL